jgi:hypothetical protein
MCQNDRTNQLYHPTEEVNYIHWAMTGRRDLLFLCVHIEKKAFILGVPTREYKRWRLRERNTKYSFQSCLGLYQIFYSSSHLGYDKVNFARSREVTKRSSKDLWWGRVYHCAFFRPCGCVLWKKKHKKVYTSMLRRHTYYIGRQALYTLLAKDIW